LIASGKGDHRPKQRTCPPDAIFIPKPESLRKSEGLVSDVVDFGTHRGMDPTKPRSPSGCSRLEV